MAKRTQVAMQIYQKMRIYVLIYNTLHVAIYVNQECVYSSHNDQFEEDYQAMHASETLKKDQSSHNTS